ncbi:Mediator of DNA damage checkpoint protein 1 [Gaertneriomyces sp. JEL0708]|nr:Mediator of DNA damage checkpoint protein 1 [Gaertneriomyces sp. JEL0708]
MVEDDEDESEEYEDEREEKTKARNAYIEKRHDEDLPADARRVVARLHVLPGGTVREPMIFDISTGLNFIGRDDQLCDAELQIHGVSGVHALIEVSPDGLLHFVEDLDSTNGTFMGPGRYRLKNYRLYQLRDGDLICFEPARCRYEVLLESPPAPAAAPQLEYSTTETVLMAPEHQSVEPEVAVEDTAGNSIEPVKGVLDAPDGYDSDTTDDGTGTETETIKPTTLSDRLPTSEAKHIGLPRYESYSLEIGGSPQLLNGTPEPTAFSGDERDIGRMSPILPDPDVSMELDDALILLAPEPAAVDTNSLSHLADTKPLAVSIPDTRVADNQAESSEEVDLGIVDFPKTLPEVTHSEVPQRTKRRLPSPSRPAARKRRKDAKGGKLPATDDGASAALLTEDANDNALANVAPVLSEPVVAADNDGHLHANGHADQEPPAEAAASHQKDAPGTRRRRKKAPAGLTSPKDENDLSKASAPSEEPDLEEKNTIKTATGSSEAKPASPRAGSLQPSAKAKSHSRKPSIERAQVVDDEISTPPSFPKVMFTGIPDSDERRKIVTMLKGEVVDSWSECTHLVTDRVRRTVKFLCALSAGKHIVSMKWLDGCKKAGKFIDVGNFLLKDAKAEKQYGFDLKRSLSVAKDQLGGRLLSGIKIHATPSVKPPVEELQEILQAAGGKMASGLPKTPPVDPRQVVVIGDPNDEEEVSSLESDGWKVQSNEFILTGLLRMHLDFDSHVLPVAKGGKTTQSPQKPNRRKRR